MNSNFYIKKDLKNIKKIVYDFFKKINTDRIFLSEYVDVSHPIYRKSMNLNLLEDRNFFRSIFFDGNFFIKWFRIIIEIPLTEQRNIFYLISDDKYRFNTTYKLLSWSDKYKAYVNRPYIKKTYNNGISGILDAFLRTSNDFSNYIPLMAKNVNRIIKGTAYSKGLITPYNTELPTINFLMKIIELSVLLITSEKLRNDISNVVSYLGFLRLKYFNDKSQAVQFLKELFTDLLIFSQKGGVKKMRDQDPEYFLDFFLDIVEPSEDLETRNHIYSKKFEKMKAIVRNEETPRFNCEKNNESLQNIKNIKILVQPLNHLDVEIHENNNINLYQIIDNFY